MKKYGKYEIMEDNLNGEIERRGREKKREAHAATRAVGTLRFHILCCRHCKNSNQHRSYTHVYTHKVFAYISTPRSTKVNESTFFLFSEN